MQKGEILMKKIINKILLSSLCATCVFFCEKNKAMFRNNFTDNVTQYGENISPQSWRQIIYNIDRQILNFVNLYGENDWENIPHYIPNCIGWKCKLRYFYYIKPRIIPNPTFASLNFSIDDFNWLEQDFLLPRK
jgi:hypothetical protein